MTNVIQLSDYVIPRPVFSPVVGISGKCVTLRLPHKGLRSLVRNDT